MPHPGCEAAICERASRRFEALSRDRAARASDWRRRSRRALYVDAFVAMGEARIGPDRSAAARLAGAIQGDTGE